MTSMLRKKLSSYVLTFLTIALLASFQVNAENNSSILIKQILKYIPSTNYNSSLFERAKNIDDFQLELPLIKNHVSLRSNNVLQDESEAIERLNHMYKTAGLRLTVTKDALTYIRMKQNSPYLALLDSEQDLKLMAGILEQNLETTTKCSEDLMSFMATIVLFLSKTDEWYKYNMARIGFCWRQRVDKINWALAKSFGKLREDTAQVVALVACEFHAQIKRKETRTEKIIDIETNNARDMVKYESKRIAALKYLVGDSKGLVIDKKPNEEFVRRLAKAITDIAEQEAVDKAWKQAADDAEEYKTPQVVDGREFFTNKLLNDYCNQIQDQLLIGTGLRVISSYASLVANGTQILQDKLNKAEPKVLEPFLLAQACAFFDRYKTAIIKTIPYATKI